MTRYTVVWIESARDELADLWINASDRAAITAAARAVDDALVSDAPTKGDALSEELRALVARPLKAIFSVREGDRIAEVLRVRRL